MKKIFLVSIFLLLGGAVFYMSGLYHSNVAQSQFSQNIDSNLAVAAFKKAHYLDFFKSAFDVNSSINREDAVYLTNQVRNLMVSTTYTDQELKSCYSDTVGSYAERSICFVKKQLGFWTSGDESKFEPQKALSRAEAVMLTGKAFNDAWFNDYNLIDNVTLPYADLVDDYNGALPIYLKLLRLKNLLPFAQNDTNFYPDNIVTKGDFIEMLWRAKLAYVYGAQAYDQQLVNQYNSDGVLCKTPRTMSVKAKNTNSSAPEKIIFAVNQSYADRNPNWQNEAVTIIKSLNKLLKSSRKTFSINRFSTFPDGVTRMQFAAQNPSYFFNNQYPGRTKGTTIFACIANSDADMLTDCPDGDSQFNTVSHGGGDDDYGVIKYTSVSDLIGARSDGLRASIIGLYHEFGHYMQVAPSHPEWYDLMAYYTSETIFNNPIPPWWQFCTIKPYSLDPMCNGDSSSLAFSALSKKIIALNSTHIYNSDKSIFNFSAEKIRFMTKIKNATAKIYGYVPKADGFGNEFILLDTQATDKKGDLYIDAPFWSKNFAFYLLDVSNGKTRKQKVVSYIDMQKANVVDYKCIANVKM